MSVCLSMIVRNEAATIERCLKSVLPFIDRWHIEDTGSTDQTPTICEDVLAHLPGAVRHAPWVDFGHNRNIGLDFSALEAPEWFLTIDADEEAVGCRDPLTLDPEVDGYTVRSAGEGADYWLTRIFKNDGHWRYQGKTHEVIICDKPNPRVERIEAFYYRDHMDGHRRTSGEKQPGDIDLLKKQIKENPTDARTMFYLGQTYLAMGKWRKARGWFENRVKQGGWLEEVYYSLLQLAVIRLQQTSDIDRSLEAFMLAYAFRRHRFEALNLALRSLRQKREAWATIYELGSVALFTALNPAMPKPNADVLFVDRSALWQALDETAIAAFHLGKRDEAQGIWTLILEAGKPDLPQSEITRIFNNRETVTG